MAVIFFGSMPHYRDHLRPVFEETSKHKDDVVMVSDYRDLYEYRDQPGGVIVVAGYKDLLRARNHARKVGMKIAFMEHGVGQTFPAGGSKASHPSYAGGPRPGVDLVMVPNELTASKVKPGPKIEVVGSPHVEHLLRRRSEAPKRSGGKTVVITFHWDSQVCPETRSAWRYYQFEVIKLANELRSEGIELVGHAHPRESVEKARWFESHDIPFVEKLEDVVCIADVLVSDGVSALYEVAALDVPVVVLNAPWYRRSVHHGLRFWEYADVGIQVDDTEHLGSAIRLAVQDADPSVRSRRRQITESLFPRDDSGWNPQELSTQAILNLIQ